MRTVGVVERGDLLWRDGHFDVYDSSIFQNPKSERTALTRRKKASLVGRDGVGEQMSRKVDLGLEFGVQSCNQ